MIWSGQGFSTPYGDIHYWTLSARPHSRGWPPDQNLLSTFLRQVQSRIVEVTKREQCEPEFFDGVEAPDPEQVFRERPDETLCTTISLRRTDECGRTLDTRKAHLGLEGVEHLLGAMVMTNGEVISDILSEGTEIPSDAFATVRERQSVCHPAATSDLRAGANCIRLLYHHCSSFSRIPSACRKSHSTAERRKINGLEGLGEKPGPSLPQTGTSFPTF
jgi:hypothetical protein